MGTNANHNKRANVFSIAAGKWDRSYDPIFPVLVWFQTCTYHSMNLYSRISQYHSKSRPSFVLFTELIAFVGGMATVVGFAYLREFLG